MRTRSASERAVRLAPSRPGPAAAPALPLARVAESSGESNAGSGGASGGGGERAPVPAPGARRVSARVVLGVAGAWALLGALWGAQTAMTAGLRGAQPMPLGPTVLAALVQALPWIPVTLVAIALAARLPVGRETWRRSVPVHLLAAVLLAYVANALVVLGFWATAGRWQGWEALLRGALRWGTVNLHVALLIYAAVVAITQAVLYRRRTRARELQLARLEGQLARAHLQALNAQIRPHFLFNTLHTIGQLWRSGRSDDADAMLDHLGSLFHKVQRVTSELEVPLADELEVVREYLAIEQARFRDRLRPCIAATPEAEECLVPPLLLQPIVENAVRHGISAASSAGVVDLRAEVRDGWLRVTVRDDGPGFDHAPVSPGTGTGLRNTRERLAQLYGAGASLDLGEAPGGGALVLLSLPASTEPRARAVPSHVGSARVVMPGAELAHG